MDTKDFLNENEELFYEGSQKTYSCDATEVAFLLGGIGTGTVSLGARGNFQDWEIFGRPAKENSIPYNFFSIWAKKCEKAPVSKVLESAIRPPYTQARGYSSGSMSGLARMESSTLRGEYPFVWVDFKDDELPVSVQLEAFNPLIPLNADDSGIPGVIIRYKVKNISESQVDVTITGSLSNVSGFAGFDLFGNMKIDGKTLNEYRDNGDIKGIFFTSKTLQPHLLNYGNMALMTKDENITVKPEWKNTGWWDGAQEFWDDFIEDGKLETFSYPSATEIPKKAKKYDIGSLGIYHTLEPGEEKTFEFILTWYFPNILKGWEEHLPAFDGLIEKNYYSTLFVDAWHTGKYLIKNMIRLEKSSRNFHHALFSSTLPSYVIEAVSSNITTLRSNTCFRIQNGTFAGWEGCHATAGSCFGTCTHVWNYAQTVAFLFPELERSARENELNLETDEEGMMAYRTNQVFGRPKFERMPAADGQLGVILRLYREWKFSGDNDFLKRVWRKAAKALEFAQTHWDTDGDFLLDGSQHNTYDIEFYGPNPLTGVLYCAALKAGTEMAAFVGDDGHAKSFSEIYEKSRHNLDELLWNGEYYRQQIDDINKYSYQFGDGCLSDQLFGQTLAHIVGLGYIMPEEHVRKTVKSIFDYNFQHELSHQTHLQRTYALNDESGLLMCSWPKGRRPKHPFVYSDEVWAGVEYQVAAHLIYEGFINEGLSIVKAVRDRYDGYKRNPWNEVECGNHYARSMSSWAVLTALSGFHVDMVKGVMSFDPAIHPDNFSTFWSTGKAWGIYSQKKDASGKLTWNVETLYGDQKVTVNPYVNGEEKP